jgi:hypothetical protein
VTWRNTDIAHGRRRENHRGFTREYFAFGANDVYVHCCHIYSLNTVCGCATVWRPDNKQPAA